MVVDNVLAAPVDLGAGRSIQPPHGWIDTGFVQANPLWLKPKNRMRWNPPKVSSVSLHWQLNATPLPSDTMSYLIELLHHPYGPVPVHMLERLHPTLIRIPLDCIIEAEILSYQGTTHLLGLTYDLVDSDECGIVHYSPTEQAEHGEFQIFGYEGHEPEFGAYFAAACAAIATFRTPRPKELKVGHSKAVVSQPMVGPPPTPTGGMGSNSGPFVSTPPSSHENLPPVSESKADVPAAQIPSTDVRTSAVEPAKIADNTTQRASTAPAPAPQVVSGTQLTRPLAPRRKTAELVRLTTDVHILESGETIKSIVSKRWPKLDDAGKETKVREVYALNRIHNNPIEAWKLQPGMKIFIPED